MKKSILICYYLLISFIGSSQVIPQEYLNLVKRADSLYKIKAYSASALMYSDAFKVTNQKATSKDRYNAACSWALAYNTDSAFLNLELLVTRNNYTNYEHLINDSDLVSLHSDKRWQTILTMVKAKKDIAEAKYNKSLIQQLDSILEDDQKNRLLIDSIGKLYGYQSEESKQHWKIIGEKDSINTLKTEIILEKYGWLETDVIGERGCETIFLVIQHSDLQIQEKYLPMIKEAVKNGKAPGKYLALLTDRIEMKNGRPQIYGSQIQIKNDRYEIYPILDEVNVNKRRMEIGLQPIEEYVRSFNIEYKIPKR